MNESYLESETADILAALGEGPAKTAAAPEYKPSESNSGLRGPTSSVESKALSLLGSGVQAEQVAAALGVSPSRIAQLLGDSAFAKEVAALRYEALQAHNKRDDKYDTLEDNLLNKLDRSMGMLIKPTDILAAIKVVNSAKRRGSSGPAQVTNQQTVVNLTLPNVIIQRFTTDMNNQVTRAGEQDLLTMPSGNLLKRVEEQEIKRLEDGGNDV